MLSWPQSGSFLLNEEETKGRVMPPAIRLCTDWHKPIRVKRRITLKLQGSQHPVLTRTEWGWIICVRATSQATNLHWYTSEAISCVTMKLIILFVFVFSLDIMTLMAAKIPRHEDGKVPVSNGGALTSYHVASLERGIQKRSAGLGDCFYRKFSLAG